ncbi:hydrogenase maturation protease, partial [bacterium]|nr:hydrogenase maturation protease [bacterium]
MGATAILGLGNVLMGDDALGPWAIERLRARWRFPESVEVEDLGTPGLDLLPHLAGRQAVILVDTVRATGDPGDVRRYGLDEVLAHAPGPRVSPHDPGLKETLASLRFAGNAPEELTLIGVIPERVDNRMGLSDAVRAALPAVE